MSNQTSTPKDKFCYPGMGLLELSPPSEPQPKNIVFVDNTKYPAHTTSGETTVAFNPTSSQTTSDNPTSFAMATPSSNTSTVHMAPEDERTLLDQLNGVFIRPTFQNREICTLSCICVY